MDSEFRELYQEIILDHNRSPRNFKKIEHCTHELEGRNPLCGDQYTIYLTVEDGVIKDIGFEGSGCAISKASASVMTATLKGKTVDDAKHLFYQFHEIVTGEKDASEYFESAGKLAAFAGVAEYPVRVKCATLPWHTLKNSLDGQNKSVSTEK
jgi:nitrogen fixation NifU-like protein